MHTSMLVKAGALSKRLVTLSAGKRSEPRVDKHVAPQIPGCYKSFVTALAFVRTLARVYTLMYSQISWLSKPL